MAILVTGGAGFIGSHTVRLLRALGREVIVLDSLERGHGKALLGAELIVGSINDEALVEKTCRQHNVSAIIHFAAYKSVGESMSSPGMYWNNNVAGTVHLAEGALAAGVQQMVFSSSASVYGNPRTAPIAEDAEIRPENVYAESKATMERVLSWYGETHDLRSVSLRYFNAAGASLDGVIGENWSVTTNLVPLVMKAALGVSGPVQVFGNDYPTPDGTGVRDYIHVEDLARAHVAALDYLATDGASTTLNLGTGVGSSVLDILDRTANEAGHEVPYEIVERRVGDPAVVFADPSAAERVLGWTSKLTLDDIVQSAYAWHASQVSS